MHKQSINRTIAAALLVLLASMSACLKEKKDSLIEPLDVLQRSNSSIRLFNFSGLPVDVMINNVALTSFDNLNGATPLGLSIFPTGKWTATDNGSPFTIINGLLNKEGKAHLVFTSAVALGKDTTLVNDVNHPRDYYLMPDGRIKVQDRLSVPPVRPENFKIRIINLGDFNDFLGLGTPLTLTYADGSPVSPLLSNIPVNTNSGYIELPYGAYQFKLFAGGSSISNTKQLAELPVNALMDGCNPANLLPQACLFPRVRTFKPGGVYTIVVIPGRFTFWDCERFQRMERIANSYRIITELDPGVNHSYARMHAVNAFPGKQVRVKVDGAFISEGALPYLGSLPANKAVVADYRIFVQGSHHIEAVDESGNVIAEETLQVYPYDNYTIWVYEKPDGTAGMLFASNDMTATLYSTTNQNQQVDDGTDGSGRRVTYPYAWQSRFLNLSPDLPYATFGNDQSLFLPWQAPGTADSIRYTSAYVNLASGVLPQRNTSIVYTLQWYNYYSYFNVEPQAEWSRVPQLIRVFRSQPGNPGQVPGQWLTQVDPLDARKAFTANPDLYAGIQAPGLETGIYSVALTGYTYKAGSAENKARIVVIKHNK